MGGALMFYGLQLRPHLKRCGNESELSTKASFDATSAQLEAWTCS